MDVCHKMELKIRRQMDESWVGSELCSLVGVGLKFVRGGVDFELGGGSSKQREMLCLTSKTVLVAASECSSEDYITRKLF